MTLGISVCVVGLQEGKWRGGGRGEEGVCPSLIMVLGPDSQTVMMLRKSGFSWHLAFLATSG